MPDEQQPEPAAPPAPTRAWRNRIIGLGEMSPEQLLANPRNHRIHPKFQQDALEGVLDDVGMVDPIIVNQTTGFIVDGHLRATLAIRTEQATIPVLFVELTEAEEAEILLTHDAIGALAGQDDQKVKELLAEVQTSDMRVQALLEKMGGEVKEKADDDEVIPLPAEPKSKLGELYRLGPHKLLVGDCTDPASWARLLEEDTEGKEAEERLVVTMLWTDPPYDVDYTGKTKAKLKILNDALGHDGTVALLTDALGLALERMPEGAPLYVFAPHGPQFLAFAVVATAQGWWRETIIWEKDSFVLGRQDYHHRHEAVVVGTKASAKTAAELDEGKEATPIGYGWKPGDAHRWYGGRYQDTVWNVNRPRVNDEHPNAKPVELATRALLSSSRPNGIVADCFAGSGTLLRSAHVHQRVARLMELDPRYADTIITWWEKTTGWKAQLIPSA
jgi:DNA modification methylase